MKRSFSLIIIIHFALLTYAQEAKLLFLNSPDSITPLLTETNRADCIDFLENNMKAQVTNRFGSISEMTELSADYLHIQVTPHSSWEMKVLSVNETDNVICTISTVCAPICDSSIEFYTTDWRKIDTAQFLSLPSMDAFLYPAVNEDPYEYDKLRSKADILFTKASLSKEKSKLTFVLTTPEYMEKGEAEKIAKYLHSPLTYEWKGQFEPSQERKP